MRHARTRVPARAVIACTLVQGRAGAGVLGATHVHVHTCSSVHTRVHGPHEGQARRTKPPPGPACQLRAVLQGGGEGFAALARFYFCFCLSSEAASARSL